MANREKELEQQRDNLVAHTRSFANRLSRTEFVISRIRQTLEISNTLDYETFKKIDSESKEFNPQHPVILEAERKIALVMGSAVGKSLLSDY
jgi:hypothetical protein